MRRLTRSVLLGLALVFAFILIWQKVRIVLWVRASGWQLLALCGVVALGIYLVLEVLLGRSGGR